MLLICPKCSARYLLSSIVLGDEGREVRCAKCHHEWYQERDDLIPQAEDTVEEVLSEVSEVADSAEEEGVKEETVEIDEIEPIPEIEDIAEEEVIDAHLDEEPIPEGVKPDHEKVNVPALAGDVLHPKVGFQARLTGYFMALLVFGLLIGGGFLFKQKIVSAWMPSAAIYELAGVPVAFKGEKLVMESLSATVQRDVDGQDFLLLEGSVINLTKDVQKVPKLQAKLRSTNGEDGDSWYIDTPLDKLEPGESFTFKSDYPAIPRGVGSVNLSFVPMVSFR